MKHVLLLAALCSTVACGSTPVAPTPPPLANVAGSWSGTMQYTKDAGNQIEAVIMNLTQAAATVNGTWATSLRDGTIAGTVTTSTFSGSFTYHSTATNGVTCTGTFAVSGPVGTGTFQWTSPLVTENCTDPPRSIILALQRR